MIFNVDTTFFSSLPWQQIDNLERWLLINSERNTMRLQNTMENI